MLLYLDRRLKWTESNGDVGVFSTLVQNTWYQYRQTRLWHKEAGGILMGRCDPDSQAMLVDELTLPGRGDKRTRHSFFRSERHNLELQTYWKQTNQLGGLLGLWHTHPEALPLPSQTDLSDLQQQLLCGKFVSNRLVYVIVGTEKIGVWISRRSCADSIELIGHISLK